MAILAALWSGSAFAHLVSLRFGDFYSGMLHPLTALEHASAFLVAGMLLGLRDAPALRAAIVGLPLAVGAGVWLGMELSGEWDFTLVNFVSLIVLGTAVALARRWWTGLVLVILVAFGLTHGFANGTAFVQGGDAWLFVLGVTTSSYLVVTLVAGLCRALLANRPAMIGVRALASWISAVGIMMLGLSVMAPTT